MRFDPLVLDFLVAILSDKYYFYYRIGERTEEDGEEQDVRKNW